MSNIPLLLYMIAGILTLFCVFYRVKFSLFDDIKSLARMGVMTRKFMLFIVIVVILSTWPAFLTWTMFEGIQSMSEQA